MSSYRRRQFPNYLLSRFNNKYPNYVSNSNLSVVYAKMGNLEIYINLDQYMSQIESTMHRSVLADFKSKHDGELDVKAELVCSSDELIKLILRKVNTLFDVVL